MNAQFQTGPILSPNIPPGVLPDVFGSGCRSASQSIAEVPHEARGVVHRVPGAAAFLDDGISQTLGSRGVVPTGHCQLREVVDGHHAHAEWALVEVRSPAVVEQLLHVILGWLRHGDVVPEAAN
jgi:hypothetical protein